MATVFFGHFGAKNHPSSHFNDHEQQLLKLAVADASESISQALIAANKNFAGHYDKIQLWFGEVTQEMIVYLKKAVYKMHSTFTDPITFIKFIDARGQYYHPYIARMPLNNIADAHYDELVMKGGERQQILKSNKSFVYHLSWPDHDENHSAHVGSVINIYICAEYFSSSRSKKMREQTILHEYSHNALFTVDYAVTRPSRVNPGDCAFIYDEEACQWLATVNSLEAIRNADCWGYFLCGFTEVEKRQIKVEAMIEQKVAQKVAVKRKRKRIFSSKLRYKNIH